MGFLGIYRALYDYAPQGEGELAINEGDLLYILEKSEDDDWWKAKKKAAPEEDEEPVGLVPSNYVERMQAIAHARSMYEYTRQTDEELSFPEDTLLAVFDTSDPDWILVGLEDDFGFAPANYIELDGGPEDDARSTTPTPPSLPTRPAAPSIQEPASPSSVPHGVASLKSDSATGRASVIQSRSSESRSPTPPPQLPMRSSLESTKSPILPLRPDSKDAIKPRKPADHLPPTSPTHHLSDDIEHSTSQRAPGGFHMYNVNEMVSVMGKRKKMPTTLGINIRAKTVLIAPEHVKNGPSQEWPGNKMTHYSREGKHVFLELVRPSKSIDFHAGAKDTAEEIVAALGELAAAVRADDLPVALLSPTGNSRKSGQVLYDFVAQGDDEVTVDAGDDVIILDDTKSDEWWQVRNVNTGKEGVVPSSYIETTGFATSQSQSPSIALGRSTVEQNRQEEIRLTKQAVRYHSGEPLPQRNKSESSKDSASPQQKTSKSKPDSSKLRTWTDRSKSFSVEAQFLGIKDGKINLHKVNGVKIAVPVEKMSHEDIEYVERVTGSPLRRDGLGSRNVRPGLESGKIASAKVGATVEPRAAGFDWFQFFLDCDVNVGLCERYAQAFAKESMDETVLSGVDSTVLRTLGLREGDIIKVMRAIDAKFGRAGKLGKDLADADVHGQSGLFSGPGGTLRNNTRKGRPAPAMQTDNVIDATALSKAGKELLVEEKVTGSTAPKPSYDRPPTKAALEGFDDDAWDVKPSRQNGSLGGLGTVPGAVSETISTQPTTANSETVTGSFQELSLLTLPLKPGLTQTTTLPAETSAAAPPLSPPAQQLGASPAFFGNINVPPEAQPSLLRQRPVVPHLPSSQGSLAPPPPPPSRPLSAPQSAQPSAFNLPPILPQLTGSVHPSLQGQVAPPGQSLSEIDQARLHEQYLRHVQATQFVPYNTQGPMPSILPTGLPGSIAQPFIPTALPTPGTFGGIPPQPSNLGAAYQPHQQLNQGPGGGLNGILPQPLEPQRTNASQAPMSLMPTAPLIPQQTGPPPPVRFGVQATAPRLTPQPTGRRANLAQATPDNPFGF